MSAVLHIVSALRADPLVGAAPQAPRDIFETKKTGAVSC